MTIRSTSIYGVYFDASGRVLLVEDNSSSLWGFPGGGIEEGETRIDALYREFLEETGMRVQGSLTYITSQHDNKKQRYFYRIEEVEGCLNEGGNGVDVESAAYFDVLNLPLRNLAPGAETIIRHCSKDI